ncbi:MAG: hypothetical protein RXQ00_05595 [Caldivirga sp.]
MESVSYPSITSYSIGNISGTSVSGLVPGFGFNIIIEVDHEFGNILIRAGDRMPKRSEEGMAFVTVGVDENDKVAYISIEPEDEDLAKFIRKIKV